MESGLQCTPQYPTANCYEANTAGSLGVVSPLIDPKAQTGSTGWTDASGNLWLLGYGALWKFDSAAQEWTWIAGPSNSSTTVLAGVYGTQGQAATGNIPGERSKATTWTDKDGNFWLYGGYGADSNGNSAPLNDLWMFNPTTRQWTWVNGNVSVNPISGSTNYAPWPAVYGAQGVAASTNSPGGREGAVGWTDSSGNLWLFGGTPTDAIGAGQLKFLNDLWKFDRSVNEWVWVGGSSTLPTQWTTLGMVDAFGQSGTYGQPGQYANGNMPGGRAYAAGWTDAQGKFWVIGGTGFDGSNVAGALNDLWKFDPSTNEWAWMGGSNSIGGSCVTSTTNSNVTYCGQPGVYGQVGLESSGNIPGGRNSAVTWIDKNGNVWLFGGNGFDSLDAQGILNDLWEYDPLSGEWTWVKGSNLVSKDSVENSSSSTDCEFSTPDFDCALQPVYGQLGIAATSNTPGGLAGAVGWADHNGGLWLFGGNQTATTYVTGHWESTFSYYNDVWVIYPAGSTIPVARPTLPPSAVSQGQQTVSISDTDSSASIYYTTDGTTPTANSTLYTKPFSVPSATTAQSAGTPSTVLVQAIAIAAGSPNSGTASANYIVYLPPATPTFTVPSGTYEAVQTITISDSTTGASIYYTTDGSTPTSKSTLYTGPITVSATETINAFAYTSGFGSSGVATASYTINLPPPTFTLGANAASMTVNSGGQATTTLTITPQNGFNSAVSFACSGLPSGATCSFSPATITPTSGAVSTQLTITASARTALQSSPAVPYFPGTALAAAVCFFGWRRRRNVQLLILLIVAAVASVAITGCGGGSAPGSTTTPVSPTTATVTVTATSGSLQQTTAISLTVN